MEAVLQIDMRDAKNRKALKRAVNKKWNMAVIKTVNVLNTRLPNLLVRGGGGGLAEFRAFTSTTLWQFLNTPGAWAELGFTDLQPLDDLLTALIDSINVRTTKKSPKSIIFEFADMQMIARFTEHPAAGQGQLRTGLSWFVDWVVKGVPVTDHRFVETGPGIPRSSMLAGSRAGLMRAGGMWSFPPIFRTAVDDWLMMNMRALKQMLEANLRKAIKQV